AQAGREVVEESTLARALLQRIASDVSACVALSDPARFRNASKSASSSSGGGAGGASGAGGAATGGATSAGRGGSPPSGGATPATGSGGSGTTGSGGTTSGDSSSDGTTGSSTSVTLPLGVQGDSSSLSLWVSKVPGEIWGDGSGAGGMVTSDL